MAHNVSIDVASSKDRGSESKSTGGTTISNIPNNTEEEQRSATTKGLANEMLDELKNLPIVLIPADPEHRDNVSDIPNKTEERLTGPTT